VPSSLVNEGDPIRRASLACGSTKRNSVLQTRCEWGGFVGLACRAWLLHARELFVEKYSGRTLAHISMATEVDPER